MYCNKVSVIAPRGTTHCLGHRRHREHRTSPLRPPRTRPSHRLSNDFIRSAPPCLLHRVLPLPFIPLAHSLSPCLNSHLATLASIIFPSQHVNNPPLRRLASCHATTLRRITNRH